MTKIEDLIFYMGDTVWFKGIYHIPSSATVYRDSTGDLMSHRNAPGDEEHNIQVRMQGGWMHLSDFFSDRNSLLVESHEYSTFSMLFGEQNTKELIFMYLRMEKYLQERG